MEEALSLDPGSVTLSFGLLSELLWYQKPLFANIDLASAAVYFVKFAFLCFFRPLIDRLHGMIAYWRVVIGICIVAFVFGICSPFVECPYFGTSAGKTR